jgi:glycosyltransferase involved in cell wall biosynthesis
MPALLNASDCLLSTSSVEGSPNTVKEALMCDLPVVATPAGDVAELLAGVEPSSLCPPEPGPLAEALAAVISGGERSNGRVAAARLSADAVAGRITALYREIAGIEPSAQESAPALARPMGSAPSR